MSTAASDVASAGLPEGVVKTVVTPGRGPPVRVGDVASVRYDCRVVSSSSSSDGGKRKAPFARSSAPQTFVIGDGTMIDGWDLALRTMSAGERSVVRLENPALAYGAAGFPPVVPENAVVELDLEVTRVEAGVDLGTIASADPLKPRTPASIAAAYNTRREQAALEEADKLEGIEGIVAKFKSFYFFGFFEGETGQSAPWYLKPSITFPIAFAVVGAAFFVLYVGGGISSRGNQVRDELDEIVTAASSATGGDVNVGAAAAAAALATQIVVSSLSTGGGVLTDHGLGGLSL